MTGRVIKTSHHYGRWEDNAISASHSRAADAINVSSTVCKSKVERLMTLSTSAVAICCSSASSRSRASSATRLCRLAAAELRRRATVDPLRRFSVTPYGVAF